MKIQKEWNKGIISPIFKNEDKRHYNNYREIVLSIPGVEEIIREIRNTLENLQCGFWTEKKCFISNIHYNTNK